MEEFISREINQMQNFKVTEVVLMYTGIYGDQSGDGYTIDR